LFGDIVPSGQWLDWIYSDYLKILLHPTVCNFVAGNIRQRPERAPASGGGICARIVWSVDTADSARYELLFSGAWIALYVSGSLSFGEILKSAVFFSRSPPQLT
jgi:hypothetical protein